MQPSVAAQGASRDRPLEAGGMRQADRAPLSFRCRVNHARCLLYKTRASTLHSSSSDFLSTPVTSLSNTHAHIALKALRAFEHTLSKSLHSSQGTSLLSSPLDLIATAI